MSKMNEDMDASRDLALSPGGVREPAEAFTLADRLALFADAMLEFWCDGSSPDGSDIQDIAQSLGLLVETTFDGEIHTDELGVGADDGDPWFVLASGLSSAIRQATSAREALEAATASPAERQVTGPGMTPESAPQ